MSAEDRLISVQRLVIGFYLYHSLRRLKRVDQTAIGQTPELPERSFYSSRVTESNGAVPRLQLAASAGSAVLFDLRLRHRGRGNGAEEGRAVLYTSYVQDWFRDGVNFRDRQTRAWDDMPEVTRRLFARLDGREYVRALEDALAARGVDVADLTSVSRHQRGKLEL
ncbi:unnamed protein product [Prorocentrum cordatum]|uniref:Uncharacterized protein n=1 Tax=Prorocentrum cordatum TaxID=2364126 RepID=A0ABN9TW63_9DINO|nr:unnamed protein product [Polarella glacialis]